MPKAEKYFGILLGYLSSDRFVAYTNAASTGTKMPRINWKDMSKYQVIIPSDEILKIYKKKFVQFITLMHNNILETKTLEIVRDSLLPKLISGELRIPNAEKIVEEAGV